MEITEITRREILDLLLLAPRPFHGHIDLISFLKRIWDLSSMPSTDHRFADAEGDIWQHMVRNEDWTYNTLLYDHLDLIGCDDSVFLKFIETCLHPLVIRDEEEAASMSEEFNKLLNQDGYCLEVSSKISGRPVYSAVKINASEHIIEDTDVYEIVLSFAGEDREYVERVAEYLKKKDVRCFYDKYEEVTLWGKDLAEHLDKVYRSARFCVMFISRHYAEKLWPNHERHSALARAVKEKGEYILPARFDDTQVPGVRHTLGYVDLRSKSPDELGYMILQKLGRNQ
ncbi:MAG: TIR domain-containing protein [Sedimentisphaerales bacterium]|jgi:hypothetical protein